VVFMVGEDGFVKLLINNGCIDWNDLSSWVRVWIEKILVWKRWSLGSDGVLPSIVNSL